MKHRNLLLADYRFPCDLPCAGYPLLGNPTKNAAPAAPKPACVRLITAVVVTVVVLAMNLPPVNSALLPTRFGALADELFLLKLAVFLTARRRLKSR